MRRIGLTLVGFVGWGLVFLLAGSPVNAKEPASDHAAKPAGKDHYTPAELAPTNHWWRFTDVTLDAGFDYEHGYTAAVIGRDGRPGPRTEPEIIAGGVAAGDYDNDGLVDLYVVRGTIGANLLFHNRGDGSFEEVGGSAGVAIENRQGAGPAFADVDGDGNLDLIVNATLNTTPHLFRNRGDGSFEEITEGSGLASIKRSTFSASFADLDGDGDLDLSLPHWNSLPSSGASPQQLFANNGAGQFTDISSASGFAAMLPRESPFRDDNEHEYTFSPNFADIDGDGWVDLIVAADFGTSMVLHNRGDGTFEDWTTPVISDQNGMGSAVGDVDNDGDLDWFVSSIYDASDQPEGNWGTTGNRLYINDGEGHFSDGTDRAGVREGYWGWGSCFQDLDNDGDLDLFHVNGWPKVGSAFEFDPSRLFVNKGDGTFEESAVLHGIDDRGMGRGVVCFDADRDGDIDIFIANNQEAPRFYRNDGGNRFNFLNVKLRGPAGNSEGIGAWVFVETSTKRQLREIRAGTNFASQDPAEAHFGLGRLPFARRVEVKWPDGAVSVRERVPANSWLVISHPSLD